MQRPRLRLLSGRLQLCFSDYQRAIALDGSLTDAYINRGDMYADRAQFDQAVRDYQRALELNPVNPRVYLSAAWLRATAPRPGYQDAAKAERLAQKGIELGGETPRGLDVYAAALARGGRFEDATRTQQRAIELRRARPEKDLERYRFRLSLTSSKKAYVDVARRRRSQLNRSPTKPQPDEGAACPRCQRSSSFSRHESPSSGEFVYCESRAEQSTADSREWPADARCAVS